MRSSPGSSMPNALRNSIFSSPSSISDTSDSTVAQTGIKCEFSLSENTAYACEPFVTTEQGGGFVRNGKIKNIFAINSRKKTKNDDADKLLNFIWENI